jgi:tetratricopeptide (TPR) repeat protein
VKAFRLAAALSFCATVASAQFISGGLGLKPAERERADALVRRAQTLARGTVADRRAAVGLLEQAIRVYRDRAPGDEAEALLQQAQLYQILNLPDSALGRSRRLLTVAGSTGDSTMLMIAHTSIASALGMMGQSDSAVASLQRARDVARRIGDGQAETVIVSRIAYTLKKSMSYDAAIVAYHDALRLSRKLGLKQVEGTILNNMGTAFAARGDLDSALAYYRSSLPLRIETGDRVGEGASLHGIGVTLANLDQRDSARVYFARALPIRRATQDREGESATLTAFGFLLSQQPGMRDSAIVLYEEALRASRDAAYDGASLTILEALAWLHYKQGRMEIALAYADSTQRLENRFGRGQNSDVSRIRIGERTQVHYALWAQIWFAIARRTGAETERYAALAAAERGRTRSLVDLMQGAGAGALAREQALGRSDAQTLSAEGRSLARGALRSADVILEYHFGPDSLLIWVITPSSIALVAEPYVREPSDTTKLYLDRVIASFQGEVEGRGANTARDALGAMIRAADSARSPGGNRGFGIGVRDSANVAIPLTVLARMLLPDTVRRLLPERGEILISPQGSLALVPFAALPTWGAVPLGERLAVRYTPSLRVITDTTSTTPTTPTTPTTAAQPAARRSRDALAGALVVANPRMPTRDPATGTAVRLPSLPGALDEGQWIAGRVGAPVLSDSAATETRVRAAMSKAPLIHLATHGLAYNSEASVRSSWVALAPSATDDGFLTVGELLDDPRLSLLAELVVLSACQTGLGQATFGEGVVGLQRALLAKGARSTLVSLWSVSDQATQRLMQRFYTHWLDDADAPSKAEAVRRAQQDVRATAGFEHPRYWAAFQLVGAR